MSDALTLASSPAAPGLASLRGVTLPTGADGSGGFLSDVIVQLGFADGGTVERAVQDSSRQGGTAEMLLLAQGVIDEGQLARAVAERNGLPFLDLGEFEVDEPAMHLIDRSMALRYRAIPVAFTGDGSLLVALADPLNALAVSDLSVVTKSQVIPAVAVPDQIDALIDELPASPPREAAEWTAGLEARTSSAPFDPGERPAGEEPDHDSGPALALAPERSSASATPAPSAERLREKIADLVEELVADASQAGSTELETEIERLRAELASERAEREALERARDEDDASRHAMAAALEETSADLERATLEASRLRTELSYMRAEAERLRPGESGVSVPPPSGH